MKIARIAVSEHDWVNSILNVRFHANLDVECGNAT